MRKVRLLVLEDEANIGVLIAEVCQLRSNVDSKIVVTGKAGLLLLEAEFFDFMLLDLSLPDMSGIDFYKSAIRIVPQLKDRCLLMSGHLPQGDVEKFLQEYKIRFLQKPFSLEVLIEILDSLTPAERPSSTPAEH